MAKSKIAQRARSPQKSAPQSVSEEILLAAARYDSTKVTMMRGDLVFAASEIRGAFEGVLEASLCNDAAEHDMLVLQALRRLRNARNIVQGGAS